MSKINSHPILMFRNEIKWYSLLTVRKSKEKKVLPLRQPCIRPGTPCIVTVWMVGDVPLACGIGKCGACEMLVDGKVRRICVTKVDGVKRYGSSPRGKWPNNMPNTGLILGKVLRTTVVIVGGRTCRISRTGRI